MRGRNRSDSRARRASGGEGIPLAATRGSVPAMSASKRVAVVGAGPSGLATVKELLEEGHQPTCFERAASLGGVFRFAQDEGVVWESCRLTSSGLLTAFSDFPVAPDHTGHMKVGEYVEYLGRYCTTFGVH